MPPDCSSLVPLRSAPPGAPVTGLSPLSLSLPGGAPAHPPPSAPACSAARDLAQGISGVSPIDTSHSARLQTTSHAALASVPRSGHTCESHSSEVGKRSGAAVALVAGRLWFQVSRYSGRLHLVCERLPEGGHGSVESQEASWAQGGDGGGAGGSRPRFAAVGVTLDPQVLEAPGPSHPAVSDWLQSLPPLPAFAPLGSAAGGGKEREGLWGCGEEEEDGRRPLLPAGACAGFEVWAAGDEIGRVKLKMQNAKQGTTDPTFP